MKTSNMRDREILARQYQDSSNLDIRKRLYQKYNTNPIDFPDWILSHVQFFQGCRVLEVGCGTGSLWQKHPELIDTFSELVLTDFSAGMMDAVRRSYSGKRNVKCQVMDILDIPFEENSFDIVIANSMLYHVTDVDAALVNVQRVLRTGGAFYVTTFGKDGVLAYIKNAMFEMGLSDSKNLSDVSFSTENGREILQRHFPLVEEERYANPLEVTDPQDLVAYIFSMASMSHVDRSNRDMIYAYFDSKRDGRGEITIPVSWCLFRCVK